MMSHHHHTEGESRSETASRVTLLGALANLLLTVFKFVAGLVGGSSAMVADALHSLSDLVSDFVVVVMVKVSSRGRDRNHGYGHGKFETLATAIVAVILLAVGVKMLVESIARVRDILSGGEITSPGRIALYAALASIVVKEVLYQWTAVVGRRINSPAMVANAWHHRSDALSSVASALGIGGAMLLGGRWTVLDPMVGGIISIVIVVVAVKMSLPAFGELTDASLPDDTETRIREIILSAEGVKNVHALKTRRSGPGIIIDSHIVVAPDMTVSDAHAITVRIEKALRDGFGSDTQITIHVEPEECPES